MQKKTAICLLIVILILLTGNSLYWAAQKEGYHCDETYSYGLSNNVFNYPVYDAEGNVRWNTPEDIKGYMVVSDGGAFDYTNVYNNQISDVHPPFFYIIVHSISSLFPDSYSPYIGIIPNLIFTIGTCIFLYLIAVHILKQRMWALLAVLSYALSVHCVNMVTYVRMYAALTFFATATVYWHIRFMENQYKLTPRLAAALFVTVFLGAYTQYYYFIFIFPVVLFFLGYMWRKWKNMLHYCVGMGITAAVYLAIWPAFFKHIFATDRGEEAFQNAVSGSLLENLKLFLGTLYTGMGLVLCALFLLLLVICIVYVCKKAKNKNESVKKNEPIFWIVVTCFFYFIVIGKIAPYQSDRYIAPMMPLICLILTVLLSTASRFLCKERVQALKTAALLAACVICIGQGINIKSVLQNREADTKRENYLYRVSEEYRGLLQRTKGLPCIMVHTHEAQFLLNLPDYMNFSKTAFVYAWELQKIRENNPLDGEKSFILFVNQTVYGDGTAAQLTEMLDFDGYEMLIWNYGRNQTHIYRVYRE